MTNAAPRTILPHPITSLGLSSILNYVHERNHVKTKKVFRVNYINRAIQLEVPTVQNSTFSSAVGIG